MTAPRSISADGAFAALAVPNFRRFVAGQALSLIGSWTETVAQALLVLHLTDSGTVLGLATASRYLPVLLLSPYAGVLVDRFDKRRLLMFTQAALAGLSIILGALIVTGTVELWAVFTIALAFGVLTALDNPGRQAFVPEIVGPHLIRNAVTLNSTFVNVGRAVGPLVAAGLVSTIGLSWCFFVNAASFAAVLVALASLNLAALHPSSHPHRTQHALRAGLRYAAGVPEIAVPLVMMVLIGTFTYEFEVSLPLFARGPLEGDTRTYSWLIGAFGFGSVVGGLYCLKRPEIGVPRLVRASVLYAAAMGATAVSQDLWMTIVLLLVVGAASITFLTTGNSTIQLAAHPDYRGRVTALWSMAFVGSTPIGATVIGWIGDTHARLAVGLGALACMCAAVIGLVYVLRRK